MALVIAVIAVIVMVIGNIMDKNTPSKKRASQDDKYKHFALYDGGVEDEDGKVNYENGVRANENQAAVVLNNSLEKDRAIIENERIYLSIDFVVRYINDKFYWDNNENVLIYTTPTDIIKSSVGSVDYYVTKVKNTLDYVIVKTEGQKVYVALDFVKQYTALDFVLYKEPNRVCITTNYGTEIQVATLKSGNKIRIDNSIKSDILVDYKEDCKVTVLETKGKWSKVGTVDGYLGYIKTSELKGITKEILSTDFKYPEYSSISKDYTISMGWHLVTSQTANDQLVDLVTSAKGLNVISPTWYRIIDNEGNMSSLASSDYVARAHLIGLEVWAMVDDQSPDSDNKQIFTYTSKREKIINQLIADAIQNNLDGINIDFEYITQDISRDYLQFLRELSVKCRINGIVLSVDDKVPEPSNLFYSRKEQGEVVDYVVIMGYDEHWGEGSGAGSVSSVPWVEEGIVNTIKDVPSNKVINAIPFYTRIWQEDVSGQYVDSQAVPMQTAIDTLTNNGVTPTFVENFGQNYGEFTSGEVVNRIWLEDATSIEAKLKFIEKYKLAGVSAWRLGFENSDIWNTIIKYTN